MRKAEIKATGLKHKIGKRTGIISIILLLVIGIAAFVWEIERFVWMVRNGVSWRGYFERYGTFT